VSRCAPDGGRTVARNMEDLVVTWLAQQDVKVYLVGGCVRDRLLGRPVYDLDVATAGDGLRLARRLANHFGGAYYPLDEARGTGRAILHGEGGRRVVVDIAPFRSPPPSSLGGPAAGQVPSGHSLAIDLADRDFTVNALAADVCTPDHVIDRHEGLAHLQARLIHPVSEASIRNDPLRALRALRLAAELGFALSPETETLIRRDGAALSRVSSERIRDELARLLALPQAAPYLGRLDDLNLLTIILPELEPLRGLIQPLPHSLDALAHSLETVRALEAILARRQEASTPGGEQQAMPNAQSPISDAQLDILAPFADRLQAHLSQMLSESRPRLVTLKLAALLHDTGKPAARTLDKDGQIHFLGHHREGTRITGKVLRRLRFTNAEVHLGETIVRQHMRPLLLAKQQSVSSRAVYRFFRDTGDAGVDVLLHALADHQATYASEGRWPRGTAPPDLNDRWPTLLALTARMLADYWERHSERVDPPPLVDGYDLLREFDLQPGPRIGHLLEAVREAQVSGQVRTHDEALALVLAHLSKMH
jgi:tRNA nucleotidyltransferase/poly(A) polymerase